MDIGDMVTTDHISPAGNVKKTVQRVFYEFNSQKTITHMAQDVEITR